MKIQYLLVPALVLFGCDEEEGHTHTEESPIAAGCDHFTYGEDQLRTATLEATPGPDATLAAAHQRYVITLPATEGTDGARLIFQAAETGEFYFMLGTDVPLKVLSGEETLTAEEVVAGGEDCPAAAKVHHYDLEAGLYTLVIGPTAETMLTMVPHLAGQDHTHAE